MSEGALELTYCEICLSNLEDDRFDYRFDFPVCHECVAKEEEVICGDCLYTIGKDCRCRKEERE